MINIFDTKFDIYGFLSSDDYVEKPQTRDTGESKRETRHKNQQIGYHFEAVLGLMIVLEHSVEQYQPQINFLSRNKPSKTESRRSFSFRWNFLKIVERKDLNFERGIVNFYDYLNAHPLII